MSEAKDESKPRGEVQLHLERVPHPEVAYDRTDLSARGVVTFLIILALSLVLVHIIGWSFFRYFSHDELTPVPRTAAITTPANQTGRRGDPVLSFPPPQLQPDPVADLNKFRGALEQQLNSYGWLDREKGLVHIPIEHAIDLVSKAGLPTRPQPVLPPQARFGSGDGTAAGAGGGVQPQGNK